MTVFVEKFTITSNGFNDFIDITSRIKTIVSNSRIENGIINIYCSSLKVAFKIFESHQGLVEDFAKILENIIPINKVFKADSSWHEGNAHAYLKALFLQNSLSFPIVNSDLQINNWQKIVFIDFDNKTSTSEIVVSIAF